MLVGLSRDGQGGRGHWVDSFLGDVVFNGVLLYKEHPSPSPPLASEYLSMMSLGRVLLATDWRSSEMLIEGSV